MGRGPDSGQITYIDVTVMSYAADAASPVFDRPRKTMACPTDYGEDPAWDDKRTVGSSLPDPDGSGWLSAARAGTGEVEHTRLSPHLLL
jgi:hypothetical protein